MTRKYDVTIWGATGFTGGLVAEYFATVITKAHPSLRWCIAGRNQQKLAKVLEKVSALRPAGAPAVDVIIGSINDQTSIDAIAKQSKVVLSTAGPFIKYGTPFVDACVRFGTHYTDITGETPWVRRLIDQFHTKAQASGAIIVPMCGFDSIPSDLGAYTMAQHMRKEFNSPAQSVMGYFISNGGPSGGTLASGQNMMNDSELQTQYNNCFLLSEPTREPRAEDRDVSEARFDDKLGLWTAPFGMAGINTRVVRRSATLHNDLFTPDFVYNEMCMVPNEKMAKKLANPPPPEVVKKLIDSGRLPAPGSGPDAATRAKSFFGILFVGRTKEGQTMMSTLQGGDPGYTETSKMVSEAAVCLALGRHAGRAGVLTPSVALADGIVQALAQAGLAFRPLKKGDPAPADGPRVLQAFFTKSKL